MNNRRDFLKTTAAVTSVLAVNAVSQVFAAEMTPYSNIIYTAANPGKWDGKQGSHAPQVTIANGKVMAATKHPMSSSHFIVRHTLILADGTFVGGKTFTPTDTPESSYDLPAGYKGKIYVTSFCNLHDFWLTEAQV